MAKTVRSRSSGRSPNSRNCAVCGLYVGPHQMYCANGHFAGY